MDTESRVDTLDNLSYWLTKALAIGANLSNFQSAELKQAMSVATILEETGNQLKELFKFQTVAFMLIDEQDYAFKLNNCILDVQVFKSCAFWILKESYPAIRYLSEAVGSKHPKSLPTICLPEGMCEKHLPQA